MVIRPHTKGMVRCPGAEEWLPARLLVSGTDQSLSSAAKSFVLLLAETLCALDLLVVLADIALQHHGQANLIDQNVVDQGQFF